MATPGRYTRVVRFKSLIFIGVWFILHTKKRNRILNIQCDIGCLTNISNNISSLKENNYMYLLNFFTVLYLILNGVFSLLFGAGFMSFGDKNYKKIPEIAIIPDMKILID